MLSIFIVVGNAGGTSSSPSTAIIIIIIIIIILALALHVALPLLLRDGSGIRRRHRRLAGRSLR